MTLQELFAIDLPVIQAPMAGVQGSAPAVAVSSALAPYFAEPGLDAVPAATLTRELAG